MSLRFLPLLVVVAALALVFLWLWRSTSTVEGAEVSATPELEHAAADLSAVETESAGGPEAPTADAPTEGSPERTPIESPGAAAPCDDRLTGEVRGYLDQVLEGAQVEVRRRVSAGTSSLDLVYNKVVHPVGRTETDGEGRFSLPVPPHLPLEVRIRAPRHATAMLDGVFGGEHLMVDLAHGAVLEGRITAESTGLGIPEIRLRGWMMRPRTRDVLAGETDASGSFRFDGLPAGELTFAVEPEVLASPGWAHLVLEPGGVMRYDAALETGIAVTGRVSDGRSGDPIAGAEVGAGWTFRRSVTTDAEGRYVLRGFGGPGVHDVHARASGYGKAQHEFPYGAMPTEDVQLDFALPPARAAIGRVVGPDGVAREGVYVAGVASVFEGRVQRTDWDATRTGADGRFRLASLTPDLRHQLLVRPVGHAVLIYDFPPDEAQHPVLDLGTIELLPGAQVVGVVVDESDRPRPDLPVALEGRGADVGRYGGADPDPLTISYTGTRESRTDRRGRFHFAGLAPGTYELRAVERGSPNEASLTVAVAAGEALDDLVLVAPLGLAIRGRVLDPEGLPCRRVIVRLASKDGRQRLPQVTSDAQGAFEITGLDPGRYDLSTYVLFFNHEDEERELYDVVLEDVQAGTDDLRVVLRAVAAITGAVLAADGSPAEDVAVEARDPATGELLARDRVVGGRFRLPLPEGVIVDLETRGIEPRGDVAYSVLDPNERTVRKPGVEAGTEDLVLRLDG